ncbi:MAG: CatA-like O-acetyltransferase [Yoonia sp.]|uniref:CatA-like O-acetyltransferase n=1 Tax=Yoonia sp. TaxID=2212373 RepID=UPI0032630A28
MTETIVDLETWPRAAQFRWFRTYDRPHYATTSRLDVSRLIARRGASDFSVYRASLFAIGCGLHAVPELLMRFRSDTVVRHATTHLSMPVPTPEGSFNYAYVPFVSDFAEFDPQTKAILHDAAAADELNAVGAGTDDVAFLSCMPWLDYTSINNAMPHKDDSIPRVTWGKYVSEAHEWKMAMTLEVHHALVDGAHVGAFFQAVQDTLDQF